MRSILAAAALAAGITACGAANATEASSASTVFTASQVSTPPANLTGTWQLDTALSDKPGPRPGGGHGAPSQGGPGGGGPPHGRPGNGGPPPDGIAPDGKLPVVTIAQSEATVIFTRADGHADTLITDGVARAITAPDGGRVEVKAWWTATALVVEHSGSRGVRQEAHSLSASGTQLTVTVHDAPAGRRAPKDRKMVFTKIG